MCGRRHRQRAHRWERGLRWRRLDRRRDPEPARLGDLPERRVELWGGFANYLYTSSIPASVDLDGTLVYDNTATYAAGAWLSGTDTTCDGTVNDAGFTGNVANSGGSALSFLNTTATFTADTCDFGSDGGGDDNADYDFGMDSTGFNYVAGDDVSVTCASGACGTEDTYSIGGSSLSEGPYPSGYLIGSTVLADTESTLSAMSFYLDDSGDCTADFYVMTASSETSTTWEVVWRDLANDVPAGDYLESADIGIVTEIGTAYFLGVRLDCTSTGTSIRYSTSPSTDAGFGTSSAYGYNLSVDSSLAVGDSLSLSTFTFYSGGVWDMTVSSVTLD